MPGPIDLYAVSVHLLTTSSSARDAEARSLRGRIEALVPDGDWLVIGGDFNTTTRDEPGIRTLASVVETQGPYPVDRAGDNSNTNAGRNKPYDWLLANDALQSREVAVEIGNNSFPHGIVLDTRVYTPIVDLAPARATDSGASGMQHMAVSSYDGGGRSPLLLRRPQRSSGTRSSTRRCSRKQSIAGCS